MSEDSWIIRNFIILHLCGFIKGIINGFLIWFLPIMTMEYGITVFTLSFIIATLLNVIASVAGGFLAEKSGKYTLLVSDLTFLFSILLLYLALLQHDVAYTFSIIFIASSVILNSVADALPTVASLVMRIESVPKVWRGKILSLGSLLSPASYALGSALLGYMYGHLEKNIFIITSIVMFITALLRLLLIETSPMKNHLVSGSKMSRNLIEGLRILIKNRYLVMLATAFLLGVSGIFSRFLSPFLRDIVGLSIAEISILYSMFNIVQLVSSIPLGHLIDVYTKRHSISLLLGASMLLNASIITMVAILAPLNRSFALLLILLPALNLLINIGLRVFIVSYFGALRSFAVAGVHATTSMGAMIMPLIGLIWILNPVLTLVISGSVPNILAASILMRIASRIEIDKKENMTSS